MKKGMRKYTVLLINGDEYHCFALNREDAIKRARNGKGNWIGCYMKRFNRPHAWLTKNERIK